MSDKLQFVATGGLAAGYRPLVGHDPDSKQGEGASDKLKFVEHLPVGAHDIEQALVL